MTKDNSIISSFLCFVTENPCPKCNAWEKEKFMEVNTFFGIKCVTKLTFIDPGN